MTTPLRRSGAGVSLASGGLDDPATAADKSATTAHVLHLPIRFGIRSIRPWAERAGGVVPLGRDAQERLLRIIRIVMGRKSMGRYVSGFFVMGRMGLYRYVDPSEASPVRRHSDVW